MVLRAEEGRKLWPALTSGVASRFPWSRPLLLLIGGEGRRGNSAALPLIGQRLIGAAHPALPWGAPGSGRIPPHPPRRVVGPGGALMGTSWAHPGQCRRCRPWSGVGTSPTGPGRPLGAAEPLSASPRAPGMLCPSCAVPPALPPRPHYGPPIPQQAASPARCPLLPLSRSTGAPRALGACPAAGKRRGPARCR